MFWFDFSIVWEIKCDKSARQAGKIPTYELPIGGGVTTIGGSYLWWRSYHVGGVTVSWRVTSDGEVI